MRWLLTGMWRLVKRTGTFVGGHMAFVVPLCLVVGIALPDAFGSIKGAVPYLFAVVTFQGSLNTTLRQVTDTFRHPRELLGILAMSTVAMPALARFVGGLVFSNPEIITGIVIEYSIPVAVVSFMWIDLFHGNASLGLAAILLSTVLAPFTIPLALSVLVGASVHIDSVSMMRDLLLQIALPAVAGVAVNQLSGGWGHEQLSPELAPVARLLSIVVITCNATGLSAYVYAADVVVLQAGAFILVFASFGFLCGMVMARCMHVPMADFYSMTFCTGMRNISSGAVIASQFFPGSAIIPVMMGTLFQQVLAATFGQILHRLTGAERERERKRVRSVWLLERYRRGRDSRR